MAKSRNFLGIQGTLDGVTIVHSKTYGEHVRIARGAKNEVQVNDTLKAHNTFLTNANKPAAMVKNAIDRYRADLPGGQLWQKLVGIFKGQVKRGESFSLGPLDGMDINQNYPLSRFLKHGVTTTISQSKDTISVTLHKLYPQFKRQFIDGYQAEIIAIFCDFELMETASGRVVSEIIPLDYAGLLTFELNEGKPGDHYIICLKLIACIRDIVQTGEAVRGMRVIYAGVKE